MSKEPRKSVGSNSQDVNLMMAGATMAHNNDAFIKKTQRIVIGLVGLTAVFCAVTFGVVVAGNNATKEVTVSGGRFLSDKVSGAPVEVVSYSEAQGADTLEGMGAEAYGQLTHFVMENEAGEWQVHKVGEARMFANSNGDEEVIVTSLMGKQFIHKNGHFIPLENEEMIDDELSQDIDEEEENSDELSQEEYDAVYGAEVQPERRRLLGGGGGGSGSGGSASSGSLAKCESRLKAWGRALKRAKARGGRRNKKASAAAFCVKFENYFNRGGFKRYCQNESDKTVWQKWVKIVKGECPDAYYWSQTSDYYMGSHPTHGLLSPKSCWHVCVIHARQNDIDVTHKNWDRTLKQSLKLPGSCAIAQSCKRTCKEYDDQYKKYGDGSGNDVEDKYGWEAAEKKGWTLPRVYAGLWNEEGTAGTKRDFTARDPGNYLEG